MTGRAKFDKQIYHTMASKIIKAAVCSFLLASALSLAAQVTSVKLTVHVPAVLPGKDVYVAGSFNGWNAGDSLFRMTKQSDGVYTITLPVFAGKSYEYKYTLGNWNNGETAINDDEIKNRQFFSAKKKKITDTVAKWREPKKQEKKQAGPQMQKITVMMDSVSKNLKGELEGMLGLLKEHILNLLQEQPSRDVDQRLHEQAMAKIATIHKQLSEVLWQVFASLTPQQKQQILTAINKAANDKDFIGGFIKTFQTVLEGQPAPK